MTRHGPHWWPAYVAIGSNLDSPHEHVLRAFDDLAGMPDTLLVARSSLYRSAPMGPQDQPFFINAVAALLSQQPAANLLQHLQAIEKQHGRDHCGDKWGPRTLDLDLLLVGTEIVATDALTLPHPGIAGRNFVLLPLHEIAPHLDVPGLGSVSRLVSALPKPGPAIEEFVVERD